MKKTLFFIFSIIICSSKGLAQEHKYSTFYEQRASLFELLPITQDDIIFLGNSITNGGEWTELFDDKRIKNRGISGDTSEGIYNRLENIVNGKPQKIFILIGINDIARKIDTNQSAMNIEKIVLKIKTVSPNTKIYLQSVMPVNPDFNKFNEHMKPDSIKQLNFKISNLSKKHEVTYINLYSSLVEEKTDKLLLQYTNDGLHLLGQGYICWRDIVLPHVNE